MKPAERFANFPPYTPIEPFDVLSKRLGLPVEAITKLDANENPYGMSPKAQAALANLRYGHIYPDPESRALRAALADFTGVDAQFLMAGAGADELIDLLLRVLLEPGDRVLNFPPTFGMYSFDTLLNAGQLVEVPRREDFSLDLETVQRVIERRRPKIAFLTGPNNPDGRMPSAAELEFLLAQELLVVLDEAYIEFAGEGQLGRDISRIGEVSQRENLVVLRTFSKWAGLAGLRVGYGAFPGWLMPVLWKAKQPYNVNVAAGEAAIASLQDLPERMDKVNRLRAERARLFAVLTACPFLDPFPSQANFILCRVRGLAALQLRDALAGRGVLTRFYDNVLLRGFIRVSVGTSEATDRLQHALEEINDELN